MMRHVCLAAVLLALTTACSAPPPVRGGSSGAAGAAVEGPEQWRITIRDSSGTDVGNLDLLVTNDVGHSCLGDFEGRQPRLARVTRNTLEATKIRLQGDSVAVWVRDKSIWIDLASPCDAYTLLEGVVSAEGVASGDVVAFGPGGGRTVGKFSAVSGVEGRRH
jgi:hypothetical protein